MPPPELAVRTSPSRTGYVAGALADGVLLLLLHVWPGWAVVPFLTPEFERVLGLVDLTLWVGVAVALAHLVSDPGWLTPAGAILTTVAGLAATVRLLTVFPFDLSSGWATAARVLLVVGVVGASIGLLAAAGSLVRLLVVSSGSRPAS